MQKKISLAVAAFLLIGIIVLAFVFLPGKETEPVRQPAPKKLPPTAEETDHVPAKDVVKETPGETPSETPEGTTPDGSAYTPRVTTVETFLCDYPDPPITEFGPCSIAAWPSQNLKRIIFTVREPSSRTIELGDGTTKEEYNENAIAHAVVDGVKQGEYLGIQGLPPPALSPDGKRYAYIAHVKDRSDWLLVVDGVEYWGYRYIGFLEFAPTGNTLAYSACNTGDERPIHKFGIINKKKLPDSDDLAPTFAFFPSGNGYIYGYSQNSVYTISINDETVAVYGDRDKRIEGIAGDLRFSPDGNHYVYGVCETALAAEDEEPSVSRYFYVVDGIEGKHYDNLVGERYDVFNFAFSDDSSRYMYLAKKNGRWFVVDGDIPTRIETEGPSYSALCNPVLGANGRTIAYIASNESHAYLGVGHPSGENILIINHEEKFRSEGISGICINQNGSKVVFLASKNDLNTVNIFSRLTGEIETLGEHPYVWIEGITDNGKVVYFTEYYGSGVSYPRDEVVELFVDGNLVGSFDSINDSQFSPDRKDMVFVVAKEGKEYATVLDPETEILIEFDEPAPGEQDIQWEIEFGPDAKHFTYAAICDSYVVVSVDGMPGRRYDEIFPCKPGNWWELYADYFVWDSPNSIHFLARKGNQVFIVQQTIE